MSHLIPRNYHSYKVEIPPGFFNLDINKKEEKIKKSIKDVEERLKKQGRVAFPKALKEINKMRNVSMFPLGGKKKSRKLVKKHNKRKSLKLKKGGTFTENINDDICVICQNELKNGESVYELSNCKHQIHSKCLNNYCEYPDSQIVIDGELRCPLCREPIKMEDCMDAWAKENDALGETPSELMGGKKNKK